MNYPEEISKRQAGRKIGTYKEDTIDIAVMKKRQAARRRLIRRRALKQGLAIPIEAMIRPSGHPNMSDENVDPVRLAKRLCMRRMRARRKFDAQLELENLLRESEQ